MHFRVTVTLRAARVERWICHEARREFLDRTPENSNYVGLDCEYTDVVPNVKQRNLRPEKKHCAADEG
jgi:hypothetical protein